MELIETVQKIDQEVSLGRPHKVILFNDEIHDMVEVIIQIEKAIHCGAGRASAIMMEAYRTCRSIVITAWLERRELVAAMLEEIRLGTKIEPV